MDRTSFAHLFRGRNKIEVEEYRNGFPVPLELQIGFSNCLWALFWNAFIVKLASFSHFGTQPCHFTPSFTFTPISK